MHGTIWERTRGRPTFREVGKTSTIGSGRPSDNRLLSVRVECFYHRGATTTGGIIPRMYQCAKTMTRVRSCEAIKQRGRAGKCPPPSKPNTVHSAMATSSRMGRRCGGAPQYIVWANGISGRRHASFGDGGLAVGRLSDWEVTGRTMDSDSDTGSVSLTEGFS
jgi:hypothetical protein